MATFIFQNILSLYEEVVSYHDRINSNITLYIANTYQQRIRFLLDKENIHHNSGNDSRESFLSISVRKNLDDVVELLIQRGHLRQKTPFHQASQQGLITMARNNLLEIKDQPKKDPEYLRTKAKSIERAERIIHLLENALWIS